MRTSCGGRRIDCAIPTPWYDATFAGWQVAQTWSSTYSAALRADATSVRIATEIMREIRTLTAIHHRTARLPRHKILLVGVGLRARLPHMTNRFHLQGHLRSGVASLGSNLQSNCCRRVRP